MISGAEKTKDSHRVQLKGIAEQTDAPEAKK